MLPGDDFTFGKPNRVQTPVGGIISNMYGERASDDLQKRYVFQKEMVSLNFDTII
jgi:hypothetical protein